MNHTEILEIAQKGLEVGTKAAAPHTQECLKSTSYLCECDCGDASWDLQRFAKNNLAALCNYILSSSTAPEITDEQKRLALVAAEEITKYPGNYVPSFVALANAFLESSKEREELEKDKELLDRIEATEGAQICVSGPLSGVVLWSNWCREVRGKMINADKPTPPLRETVREKLVNFVNYTHTPTPSPTEQTPENDPYDNDEDPVPNGRRHDV